MAKWDGMQPADLLLPLLLNEGRVDSSLLWPQTQLCQCVEETAGNGGVVKLENLMLAERRGRPSNSLPLPKVGCPGDLLKVVARVNSFG